MTRSNRTLNRLLLALVGLLFIAVAAWVANRGYPVLDVPAVPVPEDDALWIVAASALVVVILSLVWIFTRGRGRASAVITATDETGTVSIDARVAADLISHDLAALADVVSVSSTAFRTTGSATSAIALELRVVARRSADLRHLVDTVTRSVEQFDEVIESRIPVLLHVATGVRASLAHEQRVR